jgi:hypothetical protein
MNRDLTNSIADKRGRGGHEPHVDGVRRCQVPYCSDREEYNLPIVVDNVGQPLSQPVLVSTSSSFIMELRD